MFRMFQDDIMFGFYDRPPVHSVDNFSDSKDSLIDNFLTENRVFRKSEFLRLICLEFEHHTGFNDFISKPVTNRITRRKDVKIGVFFVNCPDYALYFMINLYRSYMRHSVMNYDTNRNQILNNSKIFYKDKYAINNLFEFTVDEIISNEEERETLKVEFTNLFPIKLQNILTPYINDLFYGESKYGLNDFHSFLNRLSVFTLLNEFTAYDKCYEVDSELPAVKNSDLNNNLEFDNLYEFTKSILIQHVSHECFHKGNISTHEHTEKLLTTIFTTPKEIFTVQTRETMVWEEIIINNLGKMGEKSFYHHALLGEGMNNASFQYIDNKSVLKWAHDYNKHKDNTNEHLNIPITIVNTVKQVFGHYHINLFTDRFSHEMMEQLSYITVNMPAIFNNNNEIIGTNENGQHVSIASINTDKEHNELLHIINGFRVEMAVSFSSSPTKPMISRSSTVYLYLTLFIVALKIGLEHIINKKGKDYDYFQELAYLLLYSDVLQEPVYSSHDEKARKELHNIKTLNTVIELFCHNDSMKYPAPLLLNLAGVNNRHNV